MVGEVRLAVLTTVDARRVEVDVVRKTHGDDETIGFASRSWIVFAWSGKTSTKVRSGHWALVAACHTCCWTGFRGEGRGDGAGADPGFGGVWGAEDGGTQDRAKERVLS